jgi:ABC-type bacteriocin/lantibiotic exporter with double-glycine peptidase domain
MKRLPFGGIAMVLRLTLVLLMIALPASLRCAAQAADKPLPEAFIADPEARFFYSRSNCCGLVAAYIVANRLGDPVDLETISHEIPVGPAGNSMDALARYFNEHHLATKTVTISGKDLRTILHRNSQIAAVAFVAPGHWLAIFGDEGDNCLVFDYPEWRTLDPVKFDVAFGNKAILVSMDAALLSPSPARRVIDGLFGLPGLLGLLTIVLFVGTFEGYKYFRRRMVSAWEYKRVV